ncbi:dockerin type I domain-containing protein [Paenibacillus sp. P26]|nr:dockerin type I domain-containing protein [Paenibacillus sp. P26]
MLNLTFKVKAGVQNTTGTIATTQAKLGVAPEGTVIQAALSSRSIAVGKIEVVIDKTALTTAITNAQGLYDATVVGTLPGQYPQGAKDALGVAINAAKAIKDNSSATQPQVDSATAALASAVDTFKATVIKEASADLNKDGIVDVGDLALVAYHYGKNSASADWATAKATDMNNDNKIDITDLAYVASKIFQ